MGVLKKSCGVLTAAGVVINTLSTCSGTNEASDGRIGEPPEPQWESVLNCTNISLQRAKTINITLGTSATVCLFVSLFILSLLLYFREYKTPLQRLFLFLTLLTAVQEAGLALVVEHQFHYPGQEQLCEVLGFLNQCTGTMVYMLAAQVALYLVFMVYTRLKGDPFSKISQSRCLSRLVECVYLFAPVTVVILESGYPYIGGSKYGFSVADCWIQAFNDDCENTGFKYQVASYGVDGGLGLISVICTLLLVVVYCRMAYVYRKVKCSEILLLLRQTLLLMGFLVASPLILAIGIILRFYLHSFVLSIANSIGITLSPLVIPIGYLVYIYTTTHSEQGCCKCTLFRSLKAKVKSLSKEKQDNCRQAAPSPVTEKYHKTNPTSHPQHYPSETYFNIEPTGEFTHVDIAVVTEDTSKSKPKTHEQTTTKTDTTRVPYDPVPSSTYFEVEYTGGFTDITNTIERQSLISNTTDTGYNTMA